MSRLFVFNVFLYDVRMKCRRVHHRWSNKQKTIHGKVYLIFLYCKYALLIEGVWGVRSEGWGVRGEGWEVGEGDIIIDSIEV